MAPGWLSGLGLAKLYKIVPFMACLECYGPVLGKKATPRVQDIVVEKGVENWFLLYFESVWSGAVALLCGHPHAFQVTDGHVPRHGRNRLATRAPPATC